MEINQNWSYKQCVKHIILIKKDYVDFRHFFYIDEVKKIYYEKMRKLKKDIYSLKFEEWKRDKLWEYLNNDINYYVLLSFI